MEIVLAAAPVSSSPAAAMTTINDLPDDVLSTLLAVVCASGAWPYHRELIMVSTRFERLLRRAALPGECLDRYVQYGVWPVRNDPGAVPCWIDIAVKYRLSQRAVEEFASHIPGYVISRYQRLSEAFIERHWEDLDARRVFKYQQLSEPFIERNIAHIVDWYLLARFQRLSEDFIEQHAERLQYSWYIICTYQELSEDFIARHADNVLWRTLTSNQRLSREFIMRYCHRIRHSFGVSLDRLTDSAIADMLLVGQRHRRHVRAHPRQYNHD